MVWFAHYQEIIDPKGMDNFFLRHERYVHPALALKISSASLMFVDEEVAAFCVAEDGKNQVGHEVKLRLTGWGRRFNENKYFYEIQFTVHNAPPPELFWHLRKICPNKVSQHVRFYALCVGRVVQQVH